MSKKCKWKLNEEYDGGEFWSTACGGAFTVTEGTPKDNGMKFCPYCGKKLWQLKQKGWVIDYQKAIHTDSKR